MDRPDSGQGRRPTPDSTAIRLRVAWAVACVLACVAVLAPLLGVLALLRSGGLEGAGLGRGLGVGALALLALVGTIEAVRSVRRAHAWFRSGGMASWREGIVRDATLVPSDGGEPIAVPGLGDGPVLFCVRPDAAVLADSVPGTRQSFRSVYGRVVATSATASLIALGATASAAALALEREPPAARRPPTEQLVRVVPSDASPAVSPLEQTRVLARLDVPASSVTARFFDGGRRAVYRYEEAGRVVVGVTGGAAKRYLQAGVPVVSDSGATYALWARGDFGALVRIGDQELPGGTPPADPIFLPNSEDVFFASGPMICSGASCVPAVDRPATLAPFEVSPDRRRSVAAYAPLDGGAGGLVVVTVVDAGLAIVTAIGASRPVFGPAHELAYLESDGPERVFVVRGEARWGPFRDVDTPAFSRDGARLGFRGKVGERWESFLDGRSVPDALDRPSGRPAPSGPSVPDAARFAGFASIDRDSVRAGADGAKIFFGGIRPVGPSATEIVWNASPVGAQATSSTRWHDVGLVVRGAGRRAQTGEGTPSPGRPGWLAPVIAPCPSAASALYVERIAITPHPGLDNELQVVGRFLDGSTVPCESPPLELYAAGKRLDGPHDRITSSYALPHRSEAVTAHAFVPETVRDVELRVETAPGRAPESIRIDLESGAVRASAAFARASAPPPVPSVLPVDVDPLETRTFRADRRLEGAGVVVPGDAVGARVGVACLGLSDVVVESLVVGADRARADAPVWLLLDMTFLRERALPAAACGGVEAREPVLLGSDGRTVRPASGGHAAPVAGTPVLHRWALAAGTERARIGFGDPLAPAAVLVVDVVRGVVTVEGGGARVAAGPSAVDLTREWLDRKRDEDGYLLRRMLRGPRGVPDVARAEQLAALCGAAATSSGARPEDLLFQRPREALRERLCDAAR